MVDSPSYDDLIGKRFQYGGRGPDVFDCYGLVKEMLSRQGHDVPDYNSPSEGPKIIAMMLEKRQFWRETEWKPGAVAMMRLNRNLHVGFILPHKKFIHTWDKSGGVTVEHAREWEHRVVGCYEYI